MRTSYLVGVLLSNVEERKDIDSLSYTNNCTLSAGGFIQYIKKMGVFVTFLKIFEIQLQV
jgi:hypothetical protein